MATYANASHEILDNTLTPQCDDRWGLCRWWSSIFNPRRAGLLTLLSVLFQYTQSRVSLINYYCAVINVRYPTQRHDEFFTSTASIVDSSICFFSPSDVAYSSSIHLTTKSKIQQGDTIEDRPSTAIVSLRCVHAELWQ